MIKRKAKTKASGTRASEPQPESRLRNLSNPALVGRWVWVLLVCTVVSMSEDPIVMQMRNLFIGGVMGGNLLAIWVLQKYQSRMARYVITAADLAFISLTIVLLGNSATDFFLIYFLVLAFASSSIGPLEAGVLSLVIGMVYGGLLYVELGSTIWFDRQYIVRVALLFASGLFFGMFAGESKRHRARADTATERLESVASHAKALARDKYRLRALSEIGRLGLAGSATAGRDVLYEISNRLQKGMGVDRCSLVVFADRDDGNTYVAASSDDDAVEVRRLEVGEYPELQATLASGEITEVHPGRPKELWERIKESLPNVSAFNSFLVVPIKADEKVFGAFYLRDHDPDRSFNEEERDFCWAAAMMTASFIRGRDLMHQLREQSRVDGLTGLLNFQAFTEVIETELSSSRARQESPYSLALIDMDNLKDVNDEYGHSAGNRAIKEIGSWMRRTFPNAVGICRYGGDEFVVLVKEPAETVISSLNEMLGGMSAMEWDAPFDLRASIGVAEFPTMADAPEALLEAADQAMYLAKSSGGHRVRIVNAEVDEEELHEAVVSVQTRRMMPQVIERFNAELSELQQRAVLGLRAPVVRESIAALMDAVESTDPHCRKHSSSVAELCRAVGERLGMSEEDLLRTEIAGYLHDVGKIKLPAEILTKEGTLTPDERAVVQKAPELGAKLLYRLPGLRRVAELVFTYQERWDGSGYPRGISGSAIPLGAQVIGICDVYHALTSARAQRPAIEHERARRLIEQEIGKLWNPPLAQAFLEMLEEADVTVDASEHNAPPRGAGDESVDRRQTA